MHFWQLCRGKQTIRAASQPINQGDQYGGLNFAGQQTAVTEPLPSLAERGVATRD